MIHNHELRNEYGTDPVRVDFNFTGNSTGKKVFDWKFSVAGIKERLVVDIYAHQGDGQIWFTASGPHLSDNFRNTDINVMKQEIHEELRRQIGLLTGLQWEEWFEVSVQGANSDFGDSRYSSLGANLKINVSRMKRGVDPVTGLAYTINDNNCVVAFPQPTKLNDVDNMLEGYRVMTVAERSYIPATDANRKAIDHLLNLMADLRNSVADFLSQEQITDSLSREAAQLPLLG